MASAGASRPGLRLSVVLSAQLSSFQAATFKGDLAANLERIAQLGYNGVEVSIRDPRQVDTESLWRLAQGHGLEIPAIGTGQAWGEEHLSFTDPDPAVRRAAIERIKSHVPFAARTGAAIILGLIRGLVRPGIAHDQAMAWLVEALQECSAAAEPQGVRLALEPINRYETTLINNVAQGLELIDRVGAGNFGLLLDTFHMNIEEPSMEESIRQAGKRIFHFHVADSNRWYPGGGHIDFRSLLRALEATGYRGFVSGEFLPIPDAETGAREAIKNLRGWL